MSDNGGPAFPFVIGYGEDGLSRYESGMSLRDYFAASALPELIKVHIAGAIVDGMTSRDVARECYAYADAMLAERAK